MGKVALQYYDETPGDQAYALGGHTTAGGNRIAIPAGMLGRFCVFSAEGSDAYIRFGGDSVTVDETAVSTVDDEALTEDATTPHLHVPAGTRRRFRIESDRFSHFAWKASAASGYMRFGPWTGDGT